MRLILVGFGTVGRGAAEGLIAAAAELADAGCSPVVAAIVDPLVGSVYRQEGLDLARLLALADAGAPLTDHPGAEPAPLMPDILDLVEADVVVELTPTNLVDGEPGISHARQALSAGRHLITTNKGPIALAWRELRELAAGNGVQLRFEGTVMSGTPVLGLCESGLAGAGIRSVRGIVNGTCNYILCEMEAGTGYREALHAAQQAGYAEADPSGDVDGWDAAAKALILANCVLGADLALHDVARAGISSLDAADIEAAARAGEVWRLVARVDRTASGWTAGVAPERVGNADPLAAVRGPGNLLVFDTDALGEVAIGGPGAGRRATGHAVVADLLAIHAVRGRRR
jgi:homoserine dehydrogenase